MCTAPETGGTASEDAQKLVQQVHQAHYVVDRFEDGAEQCAQHAGASGNARPVDGDRAGRDIPAAIPRPPQRWNRWVARMPFVRMARTIKQTRLDPSGLERP